MKAGYYWYRLNKMDARRDWSVGYFFSRGTRLFHKWDDGVESSFDAGHYSFGQYLGNQPHELDKPLYDIIDRLEGVNLDWVKMSPHATYDTLVEIRKELISFASSYVSHVTGSSQPDHD